MVKVTNEMCDVIKSNIYLNITGSTGRANITISGDFQGICQSIIELHEQSKPKPEPFVYYKKQPWGYDECDYDDEGSFPLYDAPPTREPLSEDALDNMLWKADSDKLDGVTMRQFKAAARLIEQAHGIGIP